MRANDSSPSKGTWLALVAILALAAALRFYHLGAQSLWNDEGTSVALSLRRFETITRNAAHDIHPPLYYYLLHLWVGLFGPTEVGARSLSAVLGVALVGGVYAFGRRLYDRSTGLLAALLAAASPLLVYYSQEARMYIPIAFWGLLSFLAFDHLMRLDTERSAGRWPWAVVYVVSSVAAIYTHYLGFAILLAQNLCVVVWLLGRWRTREGRGWLVPAGGWAGLQLLVGLAYLPWVRFSWQSLRTWPAVSEPMSLLALLGQAAQVLSLGVTVPERQRTLVLGLALSVPALVGLAGSWKASRRRGIAARPPSAPPSPLAPWESALYLLVPILFLYVLSLRRPIYKDKFLIIAAPAFCLAQARGILSLASSVPWRWLRSSVLILGTVVILAGSAYSLHGIYTDPAYRRDDYRGIVAYIEASSRNSDAILINAPSQIETVDLYYDGPLPMYPLPLKRPPDRAQVEAELAGIAARHERIYGIFWATAESDPQGLVEGWLDEHAFKTLDSWFGNVRLVVYAMPSAPSSAPTTRTGFVLGERIRLAGYSVDTSMPSGDILPLTLYWQAEKPIDRRYKVFVHLMNEGDLVVAQRDSEPGGGGAMTDGWTVGQQVVDNYGLLIPPGTPPGEYTLRIGMYALDDGARLPVQQEGQAVGDAIDLAMITVERPAAPPPLAALDMQQETAMRWGELELLGHSLHRLGQEHVSELSAGPGDVLRLTLFWRRAADVWEGYTPQELTLSLRDRHYAVAWERALAPTDGRYPLADWTPGEVVRDIHAIHLPPDLAEGEYVLNLAPAGVADQGLTLRRVTIRR